MEVLMMVAILQALCLHQGLSAPAISSKRENGTDANRNNELVKKQNAECGPHTPSLFGNCSGILLVHHHVNWVAVTLIQQSAKPKTDMAQLCKDLDCGGVFPENGTASMNTCLSDCNIKNVSIKNCIEAAPHNVSSVIEIVCAWPAVQLIGGKDRCAGRVELFGTGGWGSVCDDGWDLSGGDVVCAQLGCGTALRVMGENGDFVPGSGPIHISELKCNGTENNLWQCATELDEGRNYCGHKEDAAVVCSGSSYIEVTTINTSMPEPTNWTTENITVVAVEDNSGRISLPVLGCIILSVSLLLLLFLNAAQCAYYKKQNGGIEASRTSQASQRHNSNTSSESDHYYNPDPLQPTVNECEPTHAPDSESISETDNLLNPAINQLSPGHCIQMPPLHNTNKPAKSVSADSFDSDSTSSGECYENTGVNAEPFLQTLEGNPSFPEPSTLSHPKPQMAGNSTISQMYSPNQAADSTIDSDSTSSGECYENSGVNADAFLQTLDRNPSFPEPLPLSHIKLQMAGNSGVSQPYSPDQDDRSTSSEEPYENVTEIEGNHFIKPEKSTHSSSDSDYDDVCNW